MKTTIGIGLLVCALVGCGSVTGEPSADGGTGGAAATGGADGAVASATGGSGGVQGTGGTPGTGGAAGACGGADLTSDPNNCGACGNVCPAAEMNKPNDSQQTCFQGHCYVPSGDVCSTSSECVTAYCQKQGTGSGLCNPKPCASNADCPGATPNCDDPSKGYARCVVHPDGGASPCICSTT